MSENHLTMHTFGDALIKKMRKEAKKKYYDAETCWFELLPGAVGCDATKQEVLYELLFESLTYNLLKSGSYNFPDMNKRWISQTVGNSIPLNSEILRSAQRDNAASNVSAYFRENLIPNITVILRSTALKAVDSLVQSDSRLAKKTKVSLKSAMERNSEADYLAKVWVLTICLAAESSKGKPQLSAEGIAAPADRSSFAFYIDNERQNSIALSDLDYRSSKIPFYSRKAEISAIDAFCSDDRPVLWWSVTGNGGAGKSRLAHEYIQSHLSDGWKGLFLRDEFFTQVGGPGKYQQFIDWSYPKHLLLIVDNAQRYSESVAQWIESVVSRSNSGGNKIRILLLERTDLGDARYNDVLARHTVKFYSYSGPLPLEKLEPSEFVEFANKYAGVRGRDLSGEDIDGATAFLRKIDAEERILYFVMILDALFDEGPSLYNKWDKAKLTEHIIRGERVAIEDRFRGKPRAIRNYMHLLAFSTAAGKIDINSTPGMVKDWLSSVFDEFSSPALAGQAMLLTDNCLPPFTPDLVGEYFAIALLDEYFPFDSDKRQFVSGAWEQAPEHFAVFLVRLLSDYSLNDLLNEFKWIDIIYDEPNTEIKPVCVAYYYLLYHLAYRLVRDVGADASKYINLLDSLRNRYRYPEFAVIDARWVYDSMQDAGMSADDYRAGLEKLKGLHHKNLKNAEIALLYAQCLAYTELKYGHQGAKKEIMRLKRLAGASNDASIAAEYAGSLGLIVIYTDDDNENKNALYELQSLAGKYHHVSLHFLYATSLLTYISKVRNSIDTEADPVKTQNPVFEQNVKFIRQSVSYIATLVNSKEGDWLPDFFYSNIFDIAIDIVNAEDVACIKQLVELLSGLAEKHNGRTAIQEHYASGLFKLLIAYINHNMTQEIKLTIDRLLAHESQYTHTKEIDELYKAVKSLSDAYR